MTGFNGPLVPIAEDLQQTIERSLSQWPAIERYVTDLGPSRIDSVFFVGCGASLYVSHPAHFVLERCAPKLAAFRMTSNEFSLIRPARLGERSLVVGVSHCGTTPETVAAAETARAMGAKVVAVTDHLGSPLADRADAAFVYGSDQSDWTARHIILAGLAYALAGRTGGMDDYGQVADAFAALPAAIPHAIGSHESLSAPMAGALAEDPLIYVLAAGPLYGAACCLAMCYLQEMQWMHASAVNAGDFFHGALEIVTEDVPAIILMAEDATRPMAERAYRFVESYASKCFKIDSSDLELPGVPEERRPDVTPVVIAAVVSRLVRHFAAVRGHSLDLRRYMYKVPY